MTGVASASGAPAGRRWGSPEEGANSAGGSVVSPNMLGGFGTAARGRPAAGKSATGAGNSGTGVVNEVIGGGAAASAGDTSAPGRCTLAVIPGCCAIDEVRRRPTVMVCRLASLPTTKRPIRRAVSMVTSPPEASRSFVASISSADIPSPRSVISIRYPPSTARDTDTATGVFGGE